MSVVFLLLWPLPLVGQTDKTVFIIQYSEIGGWWGIPYAPASLPQIAPRSQKLRFTVSYRGRWGNCITTVKNAGYSVPKTLDGYARSIPIKSMDLPPEGVPTVIKTAESWMGHVLVAVNQRGVLISVVDSVGVGRIIDQSIYRGQI